MLRVVVSVAKEANEWYTEGWNDLKGLRQGASHILRGVGRAAKRALCGAELLWRGI